MFFLSPNSNESQEQAENTKDLFLSGSSGGWLTASNELSTCCSCQCWADLPFEPWPGPYGCRQKHRAWLLPSSFVNKKTLRTAEDSDHWNVIFAMQLKSWSQESRLKECQHSHPTAARNCSEPPQTFLPRTQHAIACHYPLLPPISSRKIYDMCFCTPLPGMLYTKNRSFPCDFQLASQS